MKKITLPVPPLQEQHFILARLSEDNGYEIRDAAHFDRRFACDRELLFRFLNATQPKQMDALRKIYKADLEDTERPRTIWWSTPPVPERRTPSRGWRIG